MKKQFFTASHTFTQSSCRLSISRQRLPTSKNPPEKNPDTITSQLCYWYLIHNKAKKTDAHHKKRKNWKKNLETHLYAATWINVMVHPYYIIDQNSPGWIPFIFFKNLGKIHNLYSRKKLTTEKFYIRWKQQNSTRNFYFRKKKTRIQRTLWWQRSKLWLKFWSTKWRAEKCILHSRHETQGSML